MQSAMQIKFKHTYEMHKDMVFRIAVTYVKNTHDAQDILQEVFLKLLTYKRSFSSDEHLKRWLIRCTINKSKDYLKSPWRTRRDDSQAYEGILITEKESSLLDEVFALPQEYKGVIYLHYYEGYNYEEIAAAAAVALTIGILQIPANNMASGSLTTSTA